MIDLSRCVLPRTDILGEIDGLPSYRPSDPIHIIMHYGHRYRRQDIRFPGEPSCNTCWRVPDTVKLFRGKFIYDRLCLCCREQEVARERARRYSGSLPRTNSI